MRRYAFITALFALALPFPQTHNEVIVIPTELETITLDNLHRLEEIAIIGMGNVRDMEWSPDGNTIAVATDSGAYLYNSDNLSEPTHRLQGYSVLNVEFNPDGTTLAVGGTDMPVLTTYNTTDWSVQQTFKKWAGSQLDFSSDGQYLAAGTFGDELYLLETATGEQVGYYEFVGSDLSAIAFHPDGKTIITTGINFENVRIWSVDELRKPVNDTNTIRIPPRALAATVEDIVNNFVIDETRNLFIGVDQNSIQFRDLDTYEMVARLPLETDFFAPIDISLNGEVLAYNPYGSPLAIWNVDGILQSPDAQPIELIQNVGSFALSPDGQSVAYSNSNTISIAEIGEGKVTTAMLPQICSALRISVEIVASVLRVEGCEKPLTWQLEIPGAGSISAHFHGSLMIDASGDFVNIRNVENRTVAVNLPEELKFGHIYSPILNADESWMVLGSAYAGLVFWNIESGEMIHSIDTSDMRGIFLSDDDKLLISFGEDFGFRPTIRLWGVPEA